MSLVHFHPTADPVEILTFISEFGYAIVDHLADDALLDGLASRVHR